MGTTFGSVHIYTSVSVSIDSYAFESFSEGWQTLMPAQAESAFDFEWMQRTVRAISKRTEAPVLFFFEFDGDFICFKFYQNGKQIAGYGGDGMTPCKIYIKFLHSSDLRMEISDVFLQSSDVVTWMTELRFWRNFLVFVCFRSLKFLRNRPKT